MRKEIPPIDAAYISSMVTEGPGGCLLWTGKMYLGYGVDGSNNYRIHRTAYALANGPIPKGFIVHHMCRNRACVNVEHLSAMPKHLHNRLHQDKFADELRKTLYYKKQVLKVSA